MAELIDVSSAPLVSLEDALASDALTRVLMHRGGELIAPSPLIWPLEHQDIARPHSAPVTAPDVPVYVIPSADLAGYGVSPMLDAKYIASLDLFPHYVSEFISKDIDSKYWLPREETEVVQIDSAFSVLHYNMIYGHWLLEMLPKLFIVRDLIRSGVSGEIILVSTTPSYVSDFIALIIPEATIRRFDPEQEHIHAKRLICPGMFNTNYQFNPALSSELDALVAAQGTAAGGSPPGWFERIAKRFHRGPKTKKSLFISRRYIPPSYRVMTNQLEIEEVAQSLGLTVVCPEQLDIPAQIRLFSDAELIVGEFGSGMHNALFAPVGAKVVCLNWISEVQSRLANLRRQPIGYILPHDDQPRMFHFEETKAKFTIDPKVFTQRVGDLMAASG